MSIADFVTLSLSDGRRIPNFGGVLVGYGFYSLFIIMASPGIRPSLAEIYLTFNYFNMSGIIKLSDRQFSSPILNSYPAANKTKIKT